MTPIWLKVLVVAIFASVLIFGMYALIEDKLGGMTFVALVFVSGALIVAALTIERLMECGGKIGDYAEINAKMAAAADHVSDISHELSVMVAGEIMQQGRFASDDNLTKRINRISRVVGFLYI
jgi:hypothetical protein